MSNNFHKIAEDIVSLLNKKGIGAYVWHKATTGSAYIRFEDNRMCSIRVGDHDGRERYKYKYNIRSDIKEKKWIKDSGIWRLYLPIKDWKEIVPWMEKRKEQVSSWEESRYEYKIPKHKKK